MEKGIRITAILGLVFECVYIVFGRFVLPFLLAPALFGGQKDMMNSNGTLFYLIESLVISILWIIVYLLFMILLISSNRERSEKIGMEITGLVLIGGGLGFVIGLVSLFMNYIISHEMGLVAYGAYNMLKSASAYVGIFSTVASVLMIVSCTMSICRKKFMIPMEYERGIGVNEDYTSAGYDNQFFQ